MAYGYKPAGVGEAVVPDAQRAVHVATEAFAVLAVVPFLYYVSRRRGLPAWARTVALALAIGTLVVDGGLLLSWRTRADTAS